MIGRGKSGKVGLGIPIMTLGAPPAVGAVVAHSLIFTGTEYVDLGNKAPLTYVNSGGFTCDIYWRCPALASLTNSRPYYIISQNGSWFAGIRVDTVPAGRLSYSPDGVGGVLGAPLTLVEGAWYYARYRHTVPVGVDPPIALGYFSVNAGDETETGESEIFSDIIKHYLCNKTYKFIGGLCYLHLWDEDKGPLGAVPTSPFAIDAHTVARYVFSEGTGLALGDDSDNLNTGTITGAVWSTTVPAGWAL